MVEFTIPELYTANLTKIGEIILPLRLAEEDAARRIVEAQEGEQLSDLPLALRMFGSLRCFNAAQGAAPYLQTTLGFRSHLPLYVRTK